MVSVVIVPLGKKERTGVAICGLVMVDGKCHNPIAGTANDI